MSDLRKHVTVKWKKYYRKFRANGHWVKVAKSGKNQGPTYTVVKSEIE